jgi:hypothetical protein
LVDVAAGGSTRRRVAQAPMNKHPRMAQERRISVRTRSTQRPAL